MQVKVTCHFYSLDNGQVMVSGKRDETSPEESVIFIRNLCIAALFFC